MQWIGALLFIGTTTWIGFEWSNRLANRPKHIRQVKNALQILEAEMMYSQLPLQDAFESIKKQTPFPIHSFFDQLYKNMNKDSKDFYVVWQKSLDDLMDISSLGNNEKEILLQFGQTLGQHDFLQQQKHIQLAANHLDRELENARDYYQKYGKMTKSLGVLCGIFVVLLLL
ncbi:MAG: stage III sporulation protein SpoIIIAB [Bacillota bacterium]|uniref:Stage III sporulation protein SpoAB n=1 Tax=Virgibacillus salarius TaxID=447199 RepID=A0A941DYY7_9BACI|nr:MULTISPECIES: stage III sporulation protein SpoIIIAB [Bacillaceae]NAZ09463.1 stage III sporulation protein SpoAB [Agaribacter marinus]MBR7796753.1 stage III sporulation protein SpoAB [Virgibacillus salarius]MCC2249192.1 stage III sporulation protein SpoAB [Virgibacillus sp. AGTR]MDY7043494.1 stage III sporulation protein SpoIIIAB [Virgibacillus sp. M23]QRZ16905.1 stage III sporulation protein SpoAB [Virgibacillus sp. AGTR]